ncbi:MAG: hypothetical protein EBS44_02305 [Betaproteobacteria bacterium]|nr:hypothetical protein [Betaproteobacteria bacterium]
METQMLKKLLVPALLVLGFVSTFVPSAQAQGYPNKSIRLIVPFPPGGGNDVIGRIIAQKLTERLGQQVVVDNRAGANGIVGLQALMQAPPDGYTIGVAAAGPMAVNLAQRFFLHHQYGDLSFDLGDAPFCTSQDYPRVD